MLEHFLPGAQEPMLKGYTVVAQATMRDDTREEKKERKKNSNKRTLFFFFLAQSNEAWCQACGAQRGALSNSAQATAACKTLTTLPSLEKGNYSPGRILVSVSKRSIFRCIQQSPFTLVSLIPGPQTMIPVLHTCLILIFSYFVWGLIMQKVSDLKAIT